MSRHAPVPLAKAYRLLNHGPVTLVTSAHAGRRNVMAAAWAMPLDFSPPKVLVVIDKATLTRELVEASGEFALNLPSRALAQATLGAGTTSGREVDDKFAAAGLDTFAGTATGAPLIEGCLGWLECRVLPEPHNEQRHDLFIGEVVAAWADPSAFRDGHWQFEPGAPRTVHYVAGGSFFETGEAFDASVHADTDARE